MTDERHARAKEIFLAAQERPLQQRRAYVAEACGSNADLLREVESLLLFAVDSAELTDTLAASDYFDRFRTAVADRYGIERELGTGGMATVYLAQDLKHHRSVAIKVLHPELAAVVGTERFLREIEVAAGLTHPHILPMHDSGEADGFMYYVMPYIDGETLRDRLDREKQLSLDDAVQLATEVADALSHAHRHDVIHRDIKPENILLEAGHAVVADFGIARAITAARGERLTKPGITVGTPAYMSPEQGAGRQDIDGRSDTYSLGCVLYEMLAGHPPFTGSTAQEVLARHSMDPVPPLHAARPAITDAVERAITKALAKTATDRFATAAQFAEALTAIEAAPRPRRTVITYAAIAILTTIGAYTVISRTGGPPESATAAETPKLAVLPFDNLGSSEDDYFADGITEEITSRIARISGLRVISRQSANHYKDSDKTLQLIGEELSVDYVLEGTIRTDRALDGSGRVRVTPQLIRVSDDAHLWTNPYTANLVPGEIFGVQEQIAERVADALDVTLLEPERQRLAAKPTDNQEAYDYFLRGNEYARRSTDEQDMQVAIQLYQQAVELDPEFALAYAFLSYQHAAVWWWFHDRTQERLAMAKEALDRSLRLDPDLPAAHLALGHYHYWGYLEYDRALAEFAIVQKTEPNDTRLLDGIGSVQRRQGKMQEALPNFVKAAELDPRSPDAAAQLAATYFLLRNPIEAARHYDRTIALSPDWPVGYAEKARFVHLRLEGSTEKARAVLAEARSVGLAEDPRIAYTSILVDMLDGDYQKALDRLVVVSSEVLHEDQFLYVPTAQLYAQIYGLIGSQQLERAYYDSTRSMLETKIQERPDDERFRSALGIAYAGLGRKQDAIREGELAFELLPPSKEAWRGAYRAEELARIYTMVGEYDAAVDQLESLLVVPSITAVPMLRIDPAWKPLREHPRFQSLLANYEN